MGPYHRHELALGDRPWRIVQRPFNGDGELSSLDGVHSLGLLQLGVQFLERVVAHEELEDFVGGEVDFGFSSGGQPAIVLHLEHAAGFFIEGFPLGIVDGSFELLEGLVGDGGELFVGGFFSLHLIINSTKYLSPTNILKSKLQCYRR